MNKNKQNPLGIIAIFASLAEVLGTVVLKFLPHDIQIIFVWFVILFPVLLVILFFFILYKKPECFYSPDYYRSDRAFLTVLQSLRNVSNEIVSDETIPSDTRERVQQSVDAAEQQLSELDSFNALKIKINGDEIKGDTVKAFYKEVFHYLSRNNINYESLIPFKTGSKRYLISKDGKHINGTIFYAPLLMDGNYIETNKSKIGAKLDIEKFLTELGLHVEIE